LPSSQRNKKIVDSLIVVALLAIAFATCLSVIAFTGVKERKLEFQHDLDFIISYLEKNKKMNTHPQEIPEILLFIVKELKEIKEKK
jgi:hypothetical protein